MSTLQKLVDPYVVILFVHRGLPNLCFFSVFNNFIIFSYFVTLISYTTVAMLKTNTNTGNTLFNILLMSICHTIWTGRAVLTTGTNLSSG